MNVNLPGSPRLHVWLGLLVATGGIFVGGYAYTGDRVYHIENIAVAFGGFLLLLLGSFLAGLGQANRPRLGGNPHKDDEDDSPSLIERVKGLWGSDDEGEDRLVDVTLECANCGELVDVEGQAPIEATCPTCGETETVDVPDPRIGA